MKLTKVALKKLIIEAMGTTAGEFARQGKERAAATQKGLTGEERALLLTLGKKLQDYAADKNLLAAGNITTLIKKLNTELDKVLVKTKTEEETPL